MMCLAVGASALWCLGYPAQAVRRTQEAQALAQALAHRYSLAAAQFWTAWLYYRRRDVLAVQAQADALLALATTYGFPLHVGTGSCWRGWALAMQGEGAAGLAQLRQGVAAVLATGQKLTRPLCLVLLAEAAGHVGQVEKGLQLLAEALTVLEANGRGTCWRRHIGCRAPCCCARRRRMRPRPKHTSSKPWLWPAASRLSPGSYGPP